MAEAYELLRNSMNLTVSNTVTASGSSGSFETKHFTSIASTIKVTALSGSGAVILFSLEESDDNSVWSLITSPLRFIAASNQKTLGQKISSRYFRISWSVTGANPSITFNTTSTLKSDPSITTSIFKIQTDTYTGIAAGSTVNTSSQPLSNFTLSVSSTGIVTTWIVLLEGSIDGTNFSTIAEHTNLIGNGISVFSGTNISPCLYFRTQCTSLTLGLGTNIVATVLGSQ